MNSFASANMLMACHLYSIWRSLDVTRNAEPEYGNVSMAPQDVMATRKRALDQHMVVYEPWQSPDEQTLGWVVSNHPRKPCWPTWVSCQAEPANPIYAGPTGRHVHSGRVDEIRAHGQKAWGSH